ncbi:MAG: chorismate-binding protein, partial [Pyrinomonadaceae bacterium]
MREIPFSAERLVNSLLDLPKEQNLCLLDSSNVSHLGSRFLIAGFDPLETLEIAGKSADKTLKILNEKLSQANTAAILTVSYEFGLKLNRITPRQKEFSGLNEPDVFLALFDFLIVHDYAMSKTFLTGNENRFDEAEKMLNETENSNRTKNSISRNIFITSNFTRRDYIKAVEKIQEYIRRGDTYQTNLTQQLRVRLPEKSSPKQIFYNLRKDHPAPFGSFIQRKNDTVVSASPERFFRVRDKKISVSPIKGTRRRGENAAEDEQLKQELLNSEKDRAENVMIVD